jgi:hypothetical protein
MATIKTRMVLSLALMVGGLSLTMLVEFAGATHPRPVSASPMQVSLVPAYERCTSPNRMHGPPLGSPSCNPPAQTSNFLTVGTFDANGAGANSTGFMRIKVVPRTCCPPQDVAVTGSISDVRCKAGNTGNVCTGPNSAGGPDYSGELEMDTMIRISDHNNGPNQDEAATVVDIPFPVSMFCTRTSDPSIGSTCSVASSVLALTAQGTTAPRAVVQIAQIHVFDGGPDGFIGTEGNTLFMNQGVFVP